jgi:glycosidase
MAMGAIDGLASEAIDHPTRSTMNEFDHVAWAHDAGIYEVNIRQHTPEGTLAAFEHDLPRLQRMGVRILWLMPIQPIGKRARKGTLGSYYAVSDYTAVNPEFGTLDDLARLVRATHALGMRIIIDWVANHTAWDHAWVAQHPDWYKKDANGDIHSYLYDDGRVVEHWTDVIGLDYTQPALWPAMLDAMAFWVRETGIDGFRCDVAGLVPLAFWEQAREALERIKPMFMLAEDAGAEMHRKAFDMTYDWELYDAMTRIADGQADTAALLAWLAAERSTYPADAYRMSFTTNHDKNSWVASDAEAFGASFKVFAVLAATVRGMPLIYGGQESFLDKRLAFFEKDAVPWKRFELEAFYTQLLALKRANVALWNGSSGGDVEVLPITDATLFAFRRVRGANAVTVLANLCDRECDVRACGVPGATRLAPWGWFIHTT